MRVVTTLHVKQEMTEKEGSQKLPIIIKKRTISNFDTKASDVNFIITKIGWKTWTYHRSILKPYNGN